MESKHTDRSQLLYLSPKPFDLLRRYLTWSHLHALHRFVRLHLCRQPIDTIRCRFVCWHPPENVHSGLQDQSTQPPHRLRVYIGHRYVTSRALIAEPLLELQPRFPLPGPMNIVDPHSIGVFSMPSWASGNAFLPAATHVPSNVDATWLSYKTSTPCPAAPHTMTLRLL